jgi:hypothetical protein
VSSRKAAALTYGLITVISGVAVLLIDALVGNRFLSADKWAGTRHHVYHHTLAPNVVTKGNWGGWYTLCTDGNGFKSDCHSPTRRHFDIGIIGDSFTEGIGLPYEHTFVGMIAKTHPELTVANLGVASYSPSIYLTKVKYLLSQGYTFKRIYVYVDLSDIQDEAVDYILQDGRVLSRGGRGLRNGLIEFLEETMSSTFPLSANALARIVKVGAYGGVPAVPTYLEKDFPRSAWPYNPTATGYEPVGVEGGIRNAVRAMNELYELLNRMNIRLSVGVYPWPGQLLYDTQDSRHVVLWREFCRTRCEYFFNSFPVFFTLVAQHGAVNTIRDYYIAGDFHFNEAGNRVLEETYESTISKGGRTGGFAKKPVLPAGSGSS